MVSRNSHVMSYCNELAQFARFCLGSTHFGLFGVFPPVRFAVQDIRLSLGFPLRVSVSGFCRVSVVWHSAARASVESDGQSSAGLFPCFGLGAWIAHSFHTFR